ncbi:MAG: hypothetical protein IPL89_08920 [Acidobacteria bacterium]|nr:hypothetical protein [Acidobacteriota bacterium]
MPFQRPPFGYLLSLVAVLLAWGVLVALYMSLVAFFAGVAVLGGFWVPHAKGLWELAFALGCVAFGATVALFLLKPVLRAFGDERWALHGDEPLLFAYVAACAALGQDPDRMSRTRA